MTRLILDTCAVIDLITSSIAFGLHRPCGVNAAKAGKEINNNGNTSNKHSSADG